MPAPATSFIKRQEIPHTGIMSQKLRCEHLKSVRPHQQVLIGHDAQVRRSRIIHAQQSVRKIFPDNRMGALCATQP